MAQAHDAALLYHERLEGRSIKIHCEDDLTLAIVWDAGNFAHLCGLDYYLDAVGVPEYDPVLLVEKTQGRMAEDHKWLEII